MDTTSTILQNAAATNIPITWETVPLYLHLYVTPLLVLGVLTAMTLYRRELSSNRIYLRENDHDEHQEIRISSSTISSSSSRGDQQHHHHCDQLQNSPPVETSGGDANANADNTRSSRSGLLQNIGSLAPRRLWYQTLLARHNRSASSDSDHPNSSSNSSSSNPLKELFRVMVPDLLSFTWSSDSTAAFQTAVIFVAKLARINLSNDSWIFQQLDSTRRLGRRRRRRGTQEAQSFQHPDELPPDIQVNILSFLHPKDVVTFASTSKACRDIVQGGGDDIISPVTSALWKSLFERDYAWIIHSWDIGRSAFLRSTTNASSNMTYTKEFYFRFGLGYLNYVLAGQNTQERCLIGLHGNIYDITDFISSHPGSPDTLLVHAGRDASRFFDDMDHSKGARHLAKELCIAIDTSYHNDANGSYGLQPTALFEADHADGPIPNVLQAAPVCSMNDSRTRRRGTLKRVYKDFVVEQYRHRRAFRKRLRNNKNVLHWNIFYDPFRQKWSGWYTSTEFKTVFVPNDGWDFSESQSFDEQSSTVPLSCDDDEGDDEEENQPRAFC